MAALLALAACGNDGAATAPATTPGAQVTTPAPAARPEHIYQATLRRERAETARAVNERADAAMSTPAARNITEYLAAVETGLRSRGLLRTDAGDGFTMTPQSLADDFVQIALRDEYARSGAGLVPDSHPAPLRRWEQPVHMQVVFGDSVNGPQRNRDTAEVAGFARRLTAISGHPVSASNGPGNFVVAILSEDERRNSHDRLAALVPGIPRSDLAAIAELSPQNYCAVFAYSSGNSSQYVRALAVLRAELPPLLRTSCFHEELTQGMGLANDSPVVKPSIFNDDEQFALLTQHDELLLKMLYDPRFRPGMTEAEARPIALQIAKELLGGASQ